MLNVSFQLTYIIRENNESYLNKIYSDFFDFLSKLRTIHMREFIKTSDSYLIFRTRIL